MIGSLIEAANRVCGRDSRKTPALVVSKGKAPVASARSASFGLRILARPERLLRTSLCSALRAGPPPFELAPGELAELPTTWLAGRCSNAGKII